ncbi:MAG TPA: hypothetical protein VI112_04785 [Bacteroidia bacterium]
MTKQLHIVSFDIPYPPGYGGVIDVFFKIKALHAAGVRVHLHCFEYGRAHAKELNSICASVNYYPRKKGMGFLFHGLPYIVATRSSEQMMQNILKIDAPVLFEGLHCCYDLNDARLKDRKKIVRMHNIEHDYYRSLAKVERSFFKRWYFNKEAGKLERFENVLSGADHVIAISPADAKALSARYKNVTNIIAFHPDERVQVREGRGGFALYHGNLGIGENNEAALYLVREIFSEGKIPLIVAGNNPSQELLAAAKQSANVTVKSNIPTATIYELIRDAQINILPTFQATGIKLKLLAALFNGRHCIVNSPMVANTGLEALCTICDDPSKMRKETERLFALTFDAGEIKKREEVLSRDFSNEGNVKKLLELI